MKTTKIHERKIQPSHPGEILREEFLPSYDLTVASMAASIGVSRQTVNELLREKRSLSPEMAVRLSSLFGNTPEFWLNSQQAYDLWKARATVKTKIKPLKAA